MNENNDDNSESEKEKDGRPKNENKPESCEHKSERRTAAFLTKRLGVIQDNLFDLMADMWTFEHYSEIEDVGWCLMIAQRLKRKYRKFADDGDWPEK